METASVERHEGGLDHILFGMPHPSNNQRPCGVALGRPCGLAPHGKEDSNVRQDEFRRWVDRTKTSFRQWLRMQAGRSDIVGYLELDIAVDEVRPDFATLNEWLTYANDCNYHSATVCYAIRIAWEEFNFFKPKPTDNEQERRWRLEEMALARWFLKGGPGTMPGSGMYETACYCWGDPADWPHTARRKA